MFSIDFAELSGITPNGIKFSNRIAESAGRQLRPSLETLGIAEDDARRHRACADCGSAYTILESFLRNERYFLSPYNYVNGCLTRCLACWLGVGTDSDPEPTESADLLRECGMWLGPNEHLVLLPLARTTVYEPIRLSIRLNLYPACYVELDALNVIANSGNTASLSELSSSASQVTAKEIAQHATVAFPFSFHWGEVMTRWSHASQMEFIRLLSEHVDRQCLDLIRYLQCPIEPIDALPGRAGQLDSNHMMAGALLYNAAKQEGRVLGGAAFTHIITKGVGLPVEPFADDALPNQEGEVGQLVTCALSLYSSLLESNSPTAKFIQALSLLDFLAYPDEYQNFKEVKRIVARYVAQTSAEYNQLLERLFELTGKTDPNSQRPVGYRTRVVHMGERLDQIVPNPTERRQLFEELDRYIRAMIDHMIRHSGMTYEWYLKVREEMRPWES